MLLSFSSMKVPDVWRDRGLPKRVFFAVNVTVGGRSSIMELSSSEANLACICARVFRRLSLEEALTGDGLSDVRPERFERPCRSFCGRDVARRI